MGPPTCSTPAAARSSGSRTSTPGRRSSPGSWRPDGRFVLFEGHPAEWLFDADEDGRWVATDYDYFGGAEASKGWAPEYIDHLSIEDGDQSWKFARAWTLGEIVTALLGADLRLESLAEYPIDWWGGHDDVRAEDRGRVPLSFSITGRRGPGTDRPPARLTGVDADDRRAVDRAVDVRIRLARDRRSATDSSSASRSTVSARKSRGSSR